MPHENSGPKLTELGPVTNCAGNQCHLLFLPVDASTVSRQSAVKALGTAYHASAAASPWIRLTGRALASFKTRASRLEPVWRALGLWSLQLVH